MNAFTVHRGLAKDEPSTVAGWIGTFLVWFAILAVPIGLLSALGATILRLAMRQGGGRHFGIGMRCSFDLRVPPVTFKYDPFGRRIYKSSSSGTSIYAYDDNDLIEETNASGAAVARYTQGENIDEPLAMLRSGATSYYEQDDLASVTSLSNGAGALAQTYTFDSFGNQTASSGSLTNPFRFSGREFDPESSLYFMRARYFDPATGDSSVRTRTKKGLCTTT